MNALEMVTNPHKCWCGSRDDGSLVPPSRTHCPSTAYQDAKCHSFNEGALAAMRALVAYYDEFCPNRDHTSSIVTKRCQCSYCRDELKAALEAK